MVARYFQLTGCAGSQLSREHEASKSVLTGDSGDSIPARVATWSDVLDGGVWDDGDEDV